MCEGNGYFHVGIKADEPFVRVGIRLRKYLNRTYGTCEKIIFNRRRTVCRRTGWGKEPKPPRSTEKPRTEPIGFSVFRYLSGFS